MTPATTPSTSAPTTGAPRGVPAASPEEMAGRLRLSATRLARRLRQEAETGLTPSQLSALAAIDGRGPLTLGALADFEGIAPPSITRVVAKLEADNLVTRQRDPEDGRVTRVVSTPKGRTLLGLSRRRKTEWLTTRVEQLNVDERERLAAALDTLDALTRDHTS